MKKMLLMGAALLSLNIAVAQNFKLKDATKALESAQSNHTLRIYDKAVNDLKKAQEAIDALSNSDANNYEVWYYKAAVYLLMQEYEDFQKLQPYKTAAVALDKAIALDKKKTFNKKEINTFIINAGYFYYNDGVVNMQNNKFKEAAADFDNSYKYLNYDNGAISAKVKGADDHKAKAVMYSGLGHYYAQDYKLAAERLEAASKNPLTANESNVYLNLSNAYGKLGKTQQQLATIEAGKKLFPNDPNISAAEINYYIDQGQSDQIVNKLKEEIAKDANRDDLHYNLGLTYMEIAAQQSADVSKEVEYWDKAYTTLQKALKLKPENMNYNFMTAFSGYNYGATINNIMAESDDDNLNTAYADARNKIYLNIIPMFEKVAGNYNGKDLNKITATEVTNYKRALEALSKMYLILEKDADYQRVKALINKAG